MINLMKFPTKIQFWGNMDKFEMMSTLTQDEQEFELRDKLKYYAMDDFRIEILVLRFVYELSFEEIAEELLCPSVQTVYASYKKALDQLKERKYE